MPKVRFENASCSGVDYVAEGLHLYIPGHALGSTAVEKDIPANMVNPVLRKLRAQAPFVTATILPAELPALQMSEERPVELIETPISVERHAQMSFEEFQSLCRVKQYRNGGLKITAPDGVVTKHSESDQEVALAKAYESYEQGGNK